MARNLNSIDEIASEQRSLVTRAQLIAAGYTEEQIKALIGNSALRTVRPRVYATVGSVRSWEQELLAGVLGVGRGAIASHAASARLWEWVHRPEFAISLLVKTDFSLHVHGVRRTTILPDDDVTERLGIPCTSFERTLCDCTADLTPFQLGRVLDDGLRRGVVSLKDLERCALRLDSGRGRKLSVIKVLLAQRDESFNPGGSGSELDVLQVIRDAGLPLPVQQLAVTVEGRTFYPDYAWPSLRVFAEYYGLAVHSGASAVARDNDRLSALVAAGWHPLIFDETTTERKMVERLRRVLTQGTPSDGAVENRLSA
jgi:hypothetical protein